MTDIRTITDLRKECKRVGNTYFSAGNVRYFGSNKHHGIYRAPYMPLTEGWLISETVFTDSKGVSEPTKYKLYRFELVSDPYPAVDFSLIGRYDSLAEAEAFLAAQGARK